MSVTVTCIFTNVNLNVAFWHPYCKFAVLEKNKHQMFPFTAEKKCSAFSCPECMNLHITTLTS